MKNILSVFLVLSAIIMAFVFLKGSSLNSGSLADDSVFSNTMVEMTWEEVKKASEDSSIVILPVGIVEEHGPHMDLSPDIHLSVIGCRLIKNELEKQGIKCIIAPPFYWGISQTTNMFPGTFTVRPETLQAILFDITENLKSWGFKYVFFANLHGDRLHRQSLKKSADFIRDSLDINVFDLAALPGNDHRPHAESRADKYLPDYHAGADETKIFWDYFPEKVDVEMARSLKPQNTFLPLGYVGDPANFEKERGKEILEIIATNTAGSLISFLKEEQQNNK